MPYFSPFSSCTPLMCGFQLRPGEESCWIFYDGRGLKHGPYSFAELSHWHQGNFIHDSLMVRNWNIGPGNDAVDVYSKV